jgi:2'-5' RNA ligase
MSCVPGASAVLGRGLPDEDVPRADAVNRRAFERRVPAPARNHFFALEPAPQARAALAALATDVCAATGGRVVATPNLHLTVLFIGPLPAAREAALQQAGAQASAAVAPFGIALTRLGRFPKAAVAWIGPEAAPTGLAALNAGLRAACDAAGVPCDARPYAPHLTLVRRARLDPPAACVPAAPIGWPVRELALMRSASTPEGVRYATLARWRLGG